MTDRDAFLTAICARPFDDLPRLVFADWLDEHGEPEFAAFIRLGCHLSAARGAEARLTDEQAAEYVAGARAYLPLALAQLADLVEVPAAVRDDPADYRPAEGGLAIESPALGVSVRFNRGFPQVVRCDAQTALHRLNRAFRSVPVVQLDISDRTPERGSDGLFYWRQAVTGRPAPLDVPGPVAKFWRKRWQTHTAGRRFSTFRTAGEAAAALGDAFVAMLRHRAKLPPIRPTFPDY